MHSIGIPLIIALPQEIGGVLLARLTIIVLTSSLVLVIYRWKSFLLQSTGTKLWLTLGLVCAVPYLGVNGTFYPDLLAGVALLWIGYWLSGLSRSRGTIIAATIAVLILPWLHAKYLPIQVCVIGFMLYDLYTRGWQGRGRTPAYIGAVIVLNTILLLTYNARAWGNVLDP